MSKLMLINVTHAEESRVGIVTNGVLTAFEIESFSREHLKGNIYRGVVHRIHPALEAAFVDIGAERDAFLPLDEICFRNLANQPERGEGATNGNGEGRRQVRIQEVLKPGDEILVQIVKEEFATKPPTLSTFYSLPGRYLVLLPGSEDAGISRRIEGDDRQRIRDLIDELNPPEGYGIIVRTAAGLDYGARELQRDLTYLLRLWDSIRQTAGTRRAPALVYREHDLVLRNIRDYFTPDVDEIWVDNEEVYERAREFLREVMPGKEEVLRLYNGDKPIFSQFDVESQIESIYKRRVGLRSGGSIVIDGTEALTAIDVNSGRSTRGSSQEETAFRTNREAALEIARQLRLRDVGGLIVIDFIDMRNPQHIAEVERTLRQAMHEDKARHEVARISQFGLLEVSRQRLRPAAAATSYLACPMCEGYGLVRTTESAALVGLRKIHNRIAKGDVASMRAVFPQDVGLYLLNQKRDDLALLERRYATRIQVAFSENLMPHQFESEVRLRAEGEQSGQKPRLGGIAPSEAQARGRGRRDGGRPERPARDAERPARDAERSARDGARREAPNARPATAAPAEAPKPSPEARPAEASPAKPPVTAAENGSAEGTAPGAKRSRRRRGRRRGRGTGTQAALAIAAGLRAVAEASPLLAAYLVAPEPIDEPEEEDFVDEDGGEESSGATQAAVDAAEVPPAAAYEAPEEVERVAEPDAAASEPATARASALEPSADADAEAQPARRKRTSRKRSSKVAPEPEGAEAAEAAESASAAKRKTASKKRKTTSAAGSKKRSARGRARSEASSAVPEPGSAT